MAKMTSQQVSALKPKDKPYKLNVDTGLQIRVATSGVKVWVVQYMADGRQREYRLARPYGVNSSDGYMSLADARVEAARIRAMARDGIDIQEQIEKQRLEDERLAAERKAINEAELLAAQTESLTVNDMFDKWVTDGVKRKDGNAEVKRQYSVDISPEIGEIPVRKLTEDDVRNALRKMVDRGVSRSAVIARNNLTQMFAWARKRQPWRKLLVDGDPMELIEIEKIVAEDFDLDGQRKRVLSADEIVELRDKLAAMDAAYKEAPNKRKVSQPLEQHAQLAIWIMLSTLCRVGEMSMARWEHVDFEKAEWFIPQSNVKDNVADLMIYMSQFSVEKLKQLKALTGSTGWLFPNREGDSHIDVKSITKQLGDRQWMFKLDKQGNPRKPYKNRKADNSLVLADGKNGAWTPHDLRRTGATMMQKLGVSLDTIDRCQNHVLGGSKVRRHYLHHDYADEKREAWAKLGAKLGEILSVKSSDPDTAFPPSPPCSPE